VVSAYLGAWLHEAAQPDCLLLGCTHFPILAPLLQRVAGVGFVLVDSAATTAAAVAEALHGGGLARETAGDSRRRRTLLATDGRERFARVGQHFLGELLSAASVELVDL
jgi:glutamate racemase